MLEYTLRIVRSTWVSDNLKFASREKKSKLCFREFTLKQYTATVQVEWQVQKSDTCSTKNIAYHKNIHVRPTNQKTNQAEQAFRYVKYTKKSKNQRDDLTCP